MKCCFENSTTQKRWQTLFSQQPRTNTIPFKKKILLDTRNSYSTTKWKIPTSSPLSSGFMSYHTKRLIVILLILLCLPTSSHVDGCISWFFSKPKSTSNLESSSTTPRPNMTTIPIYACPEAYNAHFCLNGATCFSVKVGDSMLYNCECAEGFVGQRCEFKDLEHTYLPARSRTMQAGLTSVVVVMIVLVVIGFIFLYARLRRKKTDLERTHLESHFDEIDRGGGGGDGGGGDRDRRDDQNLTSLPTLQKRPFSVQDL